MERMCTTMPATMKHSPVSNSQLWLDKLWKRVSKSTNVPIIIRSIPGNRGVFFIKSLNLLQIYKKIMFNV
jgi:hypothetical protein